MKKHKKRTYRKYENLNIAKLKKRRKELLLECGLSMTRFKKKMPRVTKRGEKFDVVDDKASLFRTRKGFKPSLKQQVLWLEEFVAATKELRQEVLERAVKQKAKVDS